MIHLIILFEAFTLLSGRPLCKYCFVAFSIASEWARLLMCKWYFQNSLQGCEETQHLRVYEVHIVIDSIGKYFSRNSHRLVFPHNSDQSDDHCKHSHNGPSINLFCGWCGSIRATRGASDNPSASMTQKKKKKNTNRKRTRSEAITERVSQNFNGWTVAAGKKTEKFLFYFFEGSDFINLRIIEKKEAQTHSPAKHTRPNNHISRQLTLMLLSFCVFILPGVNAPRHIRQSPSLRCELGDVSQMECDEFQTKTTTTRRCLLTSSVRLCGHLFHKWSIWTLRFHFHAKDCKWSAQSVRNVLRSIKTWMPWLQSNFNRWSNRI